MLLLQTTIYYRYVYQRSMASIEYNTKYNNNKKSCITIYIFEKSFELALLLLNVLYQKLFRFIVLHKHKVKTDICP